ncbi:MAG TPA: choice-of-anchor X domain-containing protein [Thermoanaerobaculia bacterium]|nr:choice-of-anchor X domain-containing protein [Thermoanaerobaculia bacterium]
MNTIFPKRLAVLLLASLMSLTTMAAVTTTTEVEAAAMAHDAFTLTPGTPSASRPLVIDAAPSAIVRVTAVSRTLQVALRAPDGTSFTVGDAPTAAFDGVRRDSPAVANGATYILFLQQPRSGTYTLEVTETVPLDKPLPVVALTLFENSTRALLIGGGDTYPLGGNIRLAAVVLDALGKVQNVSIAARLNLPGDAEPEEVAFRDDGTGADPVAGDAVYSAFVSPAVAGHYRIDATFAGVAASGAFRRSASAELDVVPRRALLDGTFAERTLDTNGDGLINQVGIAPRANVLEAGEYEVQVRLRASNGNAMQRSARRTLAAGSQAAEVLFDTEELARDLGVNGPYQVEIARYDRVLPADSVPADIRYSLGPTAAHDLNAFQRARLRILGGSSTGVDTDGNGRFDRLDVHLQVAVDFAGFYTWSGGLRDRNGVDLGFRTGSRSLAAGTHTITLSFDGRTIGANGVDGPYALSNFLMFGAGQSIVAVTAFRTEPYPASQFEGFPRDATPPVLSVSVTPTVLWPANHEMVEIVPTIAVSDDFDPSPSVSLVSITSNEGDDMRGDGRTSDDIVIDGSRIFLRAERSGGGNDRIYALIWRATDQVGNSTLASATVTVPHDQRK